MDEVWQHLCDALETLAGKNEPDHLTLNENGLTQRLISELERRPGYRPYWFRPEYMVDDTDGHSPRVDVVAQGRDDWHVTVGGVRFAGGEPFLALEAKRLPTKGTGREREYLTSKQVGPARGSKQTAGKGHSERAGEKGGVARFKLGRHAPKLKAVGMIGYVQRGVFKNWRSTINAWVDDLVAAARAELPWDEEDKLVLEGESPRLARLRSSNLRVSDNQRIHMRHLWVQLASTGATTGKPSARRPAKSVGP